MKQLTGLDASFLYMEDEDVFGHVSSLSVYERPSPDYRPFDEWREQIRRRLHLLEPLTRRLRNVPFNLDHPYWVPDPAFDLDFHVRHTAVPPPGGTREVAALVGRIIGRPLDRARPLWESYVIEGLEGDRFGILTKVHHAAVDGASGAELLTLMLDTSPEGDPAPPTEPLDLPATVPGDGEVLAAALGSLVRKPGRFLLLSSRTARGLGQATRNPVLTAAGQQLRDSLRGPLGTVLNVGRRRPEVRDEPPAVQPLPDAAPRTSFNARITPHRSFAYRSVPLSAVKDVKNALGATVNDVVMAVCAGGLRRYLEGRGELPDKPLVAMVPVSIRTGDEADKWTNRVSGLVATLPTDEPEAFERVRKVHESMVVAKELHDALPADMLTQFADFPPPAVFSRASRMAMRFQAGGRVDPPINLVISNVPGPREPLYAAGAKLLHYVPVSTITHGQGLNITVQSYLDTLDFGLVACAELVPDIWDLMDAIIDDFAALAEAAGLSASIVEAEPPAATEKAPTTKRTARKKAAKKKATSNKRATKKKAAKKSPAGKKASSRATLKRRDD